MVLTEETIEWYLENGEELTIFVGQDDAIIGVARQFTKAPCVVYSLKAIIKNLVEDGMTYEEAHEFYSFNIEGAWYGDKTPYVMQDIVDE